MTQNEKQDLEILKIAYEMTEWEDFLLVLNIIRDRDKEIISMYRKCHIEKMELLNESKKALAKEKGYSNWTECINDHPNCMVETLMDIIALRLYGVSSQRELLISYELSQIIDGASPSRAMAEEMVDKFLSNL